MDQNENPGVPTDAPVGTPPTPTENQPNMQPAAANQQPAFVAPPTFNQQQPNAAPNQPPVAPAPSANNPPAQIKPRKKPKIGLIIGIIAGVFVLLAGAAVAYVLLTKPTHEDFVTANDQLEAFWDDDVSSVEYDKKNLDYENGDIEEIVTNSFKRYDEYTQKKESQFKELEKSHAWNDKDVRAKYEPFKKSTEEYIKKAKAIRSTGMANMRINIACNLRTSAVLSSTNPTNEKITTTFDECKKIISENKDQVNDAYKEYYDAWYNSADKLKALYIKAKNTTTDNYSESLQVYSDISAINTDLSQKATAAAKAATEDSVTISKEYTNQYNALHDVLKEKISETE